MQRIRLLRYLLLVVLLAAPPAARAASVLEQVPRDALGLALVRNLSQVDAKAGKVLGALGSRLPGPLALLKSIAGLDAGLDLRRELLVVLLPPDDDSRQLRLAVWLPVKDYDQLVRSLDGDPQRRVAAVTLAGEDVLMVRHDDWAVVVDPDQRDRLERLSNENASPPRQLAEWSAWIDTNDAAVVVLPAGMQRLWTVAAREKVFDAPKSTEPGEASDEDLFGPAQRPRHVRGGWPAVRDWLRTMLADVPELAHWAAEADGAACGLRLDAEGNTLLGLRLAFSQDVAPGGNAEGVAEDIHAVPRLYEGGDFVVTGSGLVSPRWAVPAVAPYLRQMATDLAIEDGNKLDEAEVAKFREQVELAVADVEAFTVLSRPGEGAQGVFTNNFLALRVASTEKFLARATALVDLWNAMLDKAKGAIRLVFQAKPIKVAGHDGVEYSIDMAAAVGTPAMPELKAAMDKLFGPGGRFRLQFVGIDDHTVLLAVANETQIAQAIATIDKAARPGTAVAELRDTAKLLDETSAWQLFVSLHGYGEWLRRQMDAILGPVIGGPVVSPFPTSPPVGFAGGVAGRIVWAEMAVPLETIRAGGKYLRK